MITEVDEINNVNHQKSVEDYNFITQQMQFQKLYKTNRRFRKAVLNKRFSRTAIKPSL